MPTERKPWKSPDRKRRGRPPTVSERFDFLAEDLIIRSYGGLEDAVVVITHKPTGVVVEGRDPDHPGSHLAARKEAMRLLNEAVHGIKPEDHVPQTAAGEKISARQLEAVEAYLAEHPKLKSPNLVITAKFANVCIAWFNDRLGK